MSFIISVLVSTLILWFCFVVLREIKEFIRVFLYLIGIDSFTQSEKDEYYIGKHYRRNLILHLLYLLSFKTIKKFHEMKIDDHPVVPPVKLRTHIVTNCVLSKSEYPNIDKYFKNYEEHEVITEIPEEERKIETKKERLSRAKKLKLLT